MGKKAKVIKKNEPTEFDKLPKKVRKLIELARSSETILTLSSTFAGEIIKDRFAKDLVKMNDLAVEIRRDLGGPTDEE